MHRQPNGSNNELPSRKMRKFTQEERKYPENFRLKMALLETLQSIAVEFPDFLWPEDTFQINIL